MHKRDGRKIIADCMEQGIFVSQRNHSSWGDLQNNVDQADDTLRIRAMMRRKKLAFSNTKCNKLQLFQFLIFVHVVSLHHSSAILYD